VFWTLAPRRAPLLVGWVGGPGARRLSALPEAAALRATLRGLAPAFGLPPAALEDRLDGAELVDWSKDPLAGGGYAVFLVGSAGASEELSRPVSGTLFFAGEATEAGFAGTVDGALRSGERAARQVLETF
jgi:monoamine oxidase